MVTFLTWVLVCSSLGMVLLVWAKHWEMTTGRIILGNARPHIGLFFHRILITVEKGLPLLMRVWGEHAYRAARARVRNLLARALLSLEHTLERALSSLRRSTAEPRGSGQASAFLREVATYKRALMRRRHKEGVVEQNVGTVQ